MSEQPLRPIGTEYEEHEETSQQRITYRYRVVGHLDVPRAEVAQLISTEVTEKTPPGGTERKTS